MSDSPTSPSETAADESEDDGSARGDGPGGGPDRVVSDRGVDDILNTLEETARTDPASDPEPTPNPAAAPTDGTGTDRESADGSEPNGAAPRDGGASADEAEDGTGEDPLEDLEARVERGTVTGADVRAAEAGEGRESTTDVGDIDLSMDDLEATDDASAPGADGPLAGSTEEESGSDSSDGSSGPGLLGRFKRLLGR